MPSMKTDTQKPGGKGTSAPQNTSVGGGSRPGSSPKFVTKSSAPANPHKIRG